MTKYFSKGVLAAAAFAAATLSAHAGATLDKVKARGELICGVSQGSAGLSLPDSNGAWSGLDVDYCRALAAAALGDAAKVRFVPLSSAQRFQVLEAGDIDVLARNTTWTSTRDGTLPVLFVSPILYDGQAFMVPASLGVKASTELEGATVCVQPGTVNEQNLVDYFSANKMTFKSVVIESLPELESAFYAGRCDVYLSDASTLSASRATRASNPADFVILPERITKSPLSPVVRSDDIDWFKLASWTRNVLVEAEEFGVTQANVEEQKQSKNPAVQRLLGTQEGIGKAFGLDDAWAARVIAAVGNYGEVYDRNLGPSTPLQLERGLNALWSNGGLMYSSPVQ